MKASHLLAAAIVLSFPIIPCAPAQETETPTSSTPAAASESPSPSQSKSSSSDKARSSQSTPSSRKYPVPGATAKATATPAPIAAAGAKSTTTPAKASPTTSAAPVLKGTPEQQIRQIEDAYEAATQAHNIATIEPFMADDFVLTDSKNRVMNKRAAVAEFKKDTDTYATAKNTEMKLHAVQRDVYVVTGVSHEAGKDKAGKSFDRKFRFTDTFANRNGKWLVVATHVSLLSGP